MCASDTYCPFCASLDAAIIALAEQPERGAFAGRERVKHEPPFAPKWCGVIWQATSQQWIARSGRILLGAFPQDEASHYEAGMAYAKYLDPKATAPYPRRKRAA